MEEGIYFGLPASDYHAAPGLSHSGMTELAVSPRNYYHARIDPKRSPQRSKPAQQWGSALHARLLEPEFFPARYARKGLEKDDFDGRLILDKVDELRAWLKSHGQKVGGSKPDLVERVEAIISTWPEIEQPVLWHRVEERKKQESAGKVVLAKEEYDGVEAAAQVALADPAFRAHLVGGYPEVSFFVRDDQPGPGGSGGTGQMLKCRADYLTVPQTVDLKSFRNQHREPIEDAVNREMERYRYPQQGVWYHDLRERARRKLLRGELKVFGDVDEQFLLAFKYQAAHRFVFLFVENQPPYHLAGRRLLPAIEGGPTPEKYWTVSRSRQRDMVVLYDHWMRECGVRRAWGDGLRVEDLTQFDLPRLQFEADDELELDYLAAGAGSFGELQASEL